MERKSGWVMGRKLAFSVIRNHSGEKAVGGNPGVRHREKSSDLGRGNKGKGHQEKQMEQTDPVSMGMSNKKVKRNF